MRGRAAEAEAAWQRGVELHSAIAARYLGALLQEQGRFGEAETVLRAGVELGDPECSGLLTALISRQSEQSATEA